MAQRNTPASRSKSGPFCYDFLNDNCSRGRCWFMHGSRDEYEEFIHTGFLADHLRNLEKDGDGRYIYPTNRAPIPANFQTSNTQCRKPAPAPDSYSTSSSEQSPNQHQHNPDVDVGNLGDFVGETETNLHLFPIKMPVIEDKLDPIHEEVLEESSRELESIANRQFELEREAAALEEKKAALKEKEAEFEVRVEAQEGKEVRWEETKVTEEGQLEERHQEFDQIHRQLKEGQRQLAEDRRKLVEKTVKVEEKERKVEERERKVEEKERKVEAEQRKVEEDVRKFEEQKRQLENAANEEWRQLDATLIELSRNTAEVENEREIVIQACLGTADRLSKKK